MPTVVGVRLRFSKTLWFDPAGATPDEGDTVVVETERGTEFGMVVQAPCEVEQSALSAPLKPLLRVAGEEDMAMAAELMEKEHAALPVFRRLVEHYRLEMKPVGVEYLPGGDKIVFYFSADERVDFRELVKDLASEFHARIDMRQVGVRDEARAVGGIGHCGQRLCCVRFGGEFQPVSIRMAKEQDLPLNPLKISGLCGRLMCCLRYEFDAYKDFKSRAPKRGAIVETPAGFAKVADMNTPRETVRMRLEDGTSVTVGLADMECAKGGTCPCSVKAEAFEVVTKATTLPTVEPVARPAGKAAGKTAGKPASKTAGKQSAKQPGKQAPVEQEQQAPREGGGRKRRRRKSGGGAAAQGSSEQRQAPSQQPAAKQQAPSASDGGQAASGEAKPTRSARRRRRRRPGGTGGNEGGSSAE